MSTADLRRRTDPRALYKCSARQAISARAGGWAVLRCAQDAWIDPQTWTQDGPALRQLRRALAQFSRSGLTIAEVEEPLTLADVARKWAVDHGGERGHSMGRFCPKYLSRQRVFAAYDGDTPVAFVSFHTGAIWTLDLMRHTRTAPKGVMHALVGAAIAAAKTADVHRLSLASVADPDDRFAFAHRIKTSQSGLHRFKEAFAPHWVPLYICASGRTRLMVTILTLAIQIRWPAPLPVRADHPSRAHRANPNSVQPKHEDFSVAPQRLACEPLSALAGDAYNDQRPFKPARNA